MSLRITATTMTEEASGHRAHRAADGGWIVTGHPGRIFTRDQAITALTIAEVLALAPPPEDPLWLFVNGWRAELDLPPLTPANLLYGTRPQSAKTTAAPRNPARSNTYEVTSS
ncbi:hypothetical protein [Streptosporangium sp. NPDC002721]|uniref:hypothetical protein n=1 Tax=Streptosporangium sp. NPDC002721 TaxID=3366188 RepID=UPI00369FC3D9